MTIKLNARARQNIEDLIESAHAVGDDPQDAADLTMLLEAHDAAARLEAERDAALSEAAALREIVAGLGDSVTRADTTSAREDAEVRALCERVGYGAVMDAASRLWIRKDPLGAFVVGPCAGTVRALLAKTGGN